MATPDKSARPRASKKFPLGSGLEELCTVCRATFGAHAGQKCPSKETVAALQAEKRTPRFARSKRLPAGESPPLPPCACGAPTVTWTAADGLPRCETCAASHLDEKAAASDAEERERVHGEALLEDERRRGRPELAVACPKCHAEEGHVCRNYLGKKKPTCNERLADPGAIAALERYKARADEIRAAARARDDAWARSHGLERVADQDGMPSWEAPKDLELKVQEAPASRRAEGWHDEQLDLFQRSLCEAPVAA